MLVKTCLKKVPELRTEENRVWPFTYAYFPCRISKRVTDWLVGWTAMEHIPKSFILNMTSEAKVRSIVQKIRTLSERTTSSPPDISWFDTEFDPDELGPLLPFSAYCITGTAGAGKSTSIAAIYQNLNCLITGATVVAAQNLSKTLHTFCPTIYTAFGFKSRHINLLNRKPQIPSQLEPDITTLQYYEISKYWAVIKDIMSEFTKKKKYGLYGSMSERAFSTLSCLSGPQMWTTNIIVIDEAGTLSSHVLMAIVFLWWFFNGWLNTKQYVQGKMPCVVCVGSPTQTDAYQSLFDHGTQRQRVRECDNILSLLIGNNAVSTYVNISENWALFINNKRCTDPEFGHMLKVLEYGLEVSEDVMEYINRLVVPKSKIMDPMQYIGWTRLFLSHAEVKQYLSALHCALSAQQGDSACTLFTCPIVCEIFHGAVDEYKDAVHLPNLSPLEWLTRNTYRLSNYSQFVDQDMTTVCTEVGETSTKVTFATKFVKGSYVSVNGKTKKCFLGFIGTYSQFRKLLDSESFLDTHGHEQPEHAYVFLSNLLYNAMYTFYHAAVQASCQAYLDALSTSPIPSVLCKSNVEVNSLEDLDTLSATEDMFYHKTLPPPTVKSTSLANIIAVYSSLKDVFYARLGAAEQHLSPSFPDTTFSTFLCNTIVKNYVDYVSAEPVHGLLDYASTVESYRLQGYTFSPIYFGKAFLQNTLSKDLQDKLPHLVVQDSDGFICCLENNITKMTEILEGGSQIHMCSVGDYGISSKLAMTIAKAQGLSLDKVAVCFGNHSKIKRSHVYVALSRATDANHLVIDSNPLSSKDCEMDICESSKHIVAALCNPKTLLVY
ncbi:ORF44 [Ovine gammaherpesvirus 2]|uniref:ORF44 n=1 Tax=Ovine gammaherpesvirus 2 TaxID=10398 RepID=Q2VSJ8_9GAMA|nr:ORF44 [Ovine gammaherpesvirus 2]AAX58078.1 ORF44 [Ovine gammaherpesvirus 2]